MFTPKRLLLSLLFIGFTFYFLFRNLDLHKLFDSLVHLQPGWLLLGLAVYMLGYVIRGFRWVVLLSPVKKCSFKSLFPTLIIGFMANNIFPFRAGEFLRAHLNGKKEGISRSSSLATIVLERIFDGLTMIVVLWVAFGAGHLPIQESSMPDYIQKGIDRSPYFFGAAFLILFAMVLFKPTAISIMNFFISLAPSRFHDKLGRFSHTFIDGLHILKNVRETFLVLLTSFAAWTCEFTLYYLLAIAMGMAPQPLTIGSVALLMALVNLGIMIPNSPGGIGLFEFIGVALLLPFGITKESAVGYMFLVHFLVLIPITFLGLYYAAKEHLNLGNLKAQTESVKPKRKPKKQKARR